MKNPCFGVQTRAAAIQGNTQLHPGQSGQGIYRTCLCRTDVGRCQYSKSGPGVAGTVQCRHLGQHVHQLADTTPGDEADQNIHPIRRLQLSAQLTQQRWVGFG